MRGTVAALGLVVVGLAVILLRGDEQGGRGEASAAVRTLVRHCDAGSSVRAPTGRFAEHDLRAGRLVIYAFRKNFEYASADEVFSPRPGVRILKAPVVFAGAHDLTLSVPRAYRRVLRLEYDVTGSRIRFEACPRHGAASGFPGGFRYTGPWPQCVPLDVIGAGLENERVLLPFGRSCAQPL